MSSPYGWPEFERGPDGALMLRVSPAYVEAAKELKRLRAPFSIAEEVHIGDWPGSPDLRVVESWLKHQGADDQELEVIYWLAANVVTEWEQLPKRTSSMHEELYKKISVLCEELGEALDETGTFYYRGGGHGLMGPSVFDLLTKPEEVAINRALEDLGGLDRFRHGLQFPRFDELLARVGEAAKRLLSEGPIHAQPNKRGAERGYFVRRMAEILRSRYGHVSAEMLAALTSVVLGVATDRELVAKLLKA